MELEKTLVKVRLDSKGGQIEVNLKENNSLEYSLEGVIHNSILWPPK